MGFRIASIELIRLLNAEALEPQVVKNEAGEILRESKPFRSAIDDSLSTKNVSKVLFDTRQINLANWDMGETLFLALKDKRDGHDFVETAYQLGIRQFLVSEVQEDWKNFESCIFYKVENVLGSLQQLASWYRTQLRMPVVGITGSNGKTVVKEWLFEL